ncbi:Dihydroorotase [Salmonella enterica subsp. arizonae]|uniref:Dihydroorotase n=1 Tax=Salmonella enterica subsp. arizonae TaxID=59203 RepID=A0A379S4C3_SALER|nr:Dihydroorotase [Salmonella enterica subsp. arizonae]
MTAPSQVLKIHRPDDWHVHLRDGDMLKTVVPYTSEIYGRAIVMPNLASPSRLLMRRSPTASVFSMRCPPGMISRR